MSGLKTLELLSGGLVSVVVGTVQVTGHGLKAS